MTEIKTGKYWLSTLNADTKKRFMKNLEKEIHQDDFLKSQHTFSEFISGAFIWSSTPEGTEYWKKCSQLD